MQIHFHTNLDEAQPYVRHLAYSWPDNILPRKGERISFRFTPSDRKGFELEVCSVSYNENGAASVELHIPSYRMGSIADWSEWFKRHRDSE
jgi:hypothetical protein